MAWATILTAATSGMATPSRKGAAAYRVAGHMADIVNEIEAASAMVVLSTWPQLTDGLWLHFVDNVAAERSLVKGSSKAEGLNTIANMTWTVAAARSLLLWVDRVSTKDNPIDGVSRGDWRCHGQDWQRVTARVPALAQTHHPTI